MKMKKTIKNLFALTRVLGLVAILALAACSSRPHNQVQPRQSALQLAKASFSTDSPVEMTLKKGLFKGMVTKVAADQIEVGKIKFRIDELSGVPAGIKVGGVIEVFSILLPDQTQYAQAVSFAQASDVTNLIGEFEFYGLVQQMSDEIWVVSDLEFHITKDTAIDMAIEMGDLVKIEGNMLSGSLIAVEIEKDTDYVPGQDTPLAPGFHEIEISGMIEAMTDDTWIVSGQSFMVTPLTEIEGTFVIGDMVTVELLITAEGDVFAKEISMYEEDEMDGEDDQDEAGENQDGTDDEEDVEETAQFMGKSLNAIKVLQHRALNSRRCQMVKR